ncbi:DUF397 domain-containing protein [Spirillospora sp. CA-294931]|uniref:DUF397 domain-containing protein n=1 Tax=Spirillospora sp. CA-294931 TaxID=3240042 RepID=UPI003D8EC5EB
MTQWRKSSRSTSAEESNCVEVADLAGNIGVRDSKDPDGPRLALTVADWRSLTQQIKQGGSQTA